MPWGDFRCAAEVVHKRCIDGGAACFIEVVRVPSAIRIRVLKNDSFSADSVIAHVHVTSIYDT